MFGIEAINVVISLIFIYLLFSLFVSIVNQIISDIFNTRGNQLFESIKELIGEKGIQELNKDPRISVLVRSGSVISTAKTELSELKNKRFPNYIPESLFGEIIADIDNTKLGGLLGKLTDDVNKDIRNKKEQVQEAFEITLLKTRESYKRNIKLLTFFIGLLVTVSFNVDSIQIFKELAKNPETAAQMAELAESYIAQHDSLNIPESESIKELKVELDNLYTSQIRGINSSMGIGWDNYPMEGNWFYRIIGWLITTLALSLGAPFWFDMLKKVINIKNELKPKEVKP